MKEKSAALALLTVLLAVSLTVGLAACASGVGGSSEGGAPPSEEELTRAFHEAELAYSWFSGYSQIEADSRRVKYVDGDPYYEVSREGISSRAELYEHLCSYFPESFARELLDRKARDGYLYSDIDGKLHVFGGCVGIYTYDMVETKQDIRYESRDRITLSASISWEVDDRIYGCTHDYQYEKSDDGRWRFTNFLLPAKLCVDSAESGLATEVFVFGDLRYLRDGGEWRLIGERGANAEAEWEPQPEIDSLDDYSTAVQEARQSVHTNAIAVRDAGSFERIALAWMNEYFAVHQALPKDNMAHITEGVVDRFGVLATAKEGRTSAFVFSVTYSVRPTYPIARNSYWMAGNTGNSPGKDETWGQMYREIALRVGDDGTYHLAEMGTGGVRISREL